MPKTNPPTTAPRQRIEGNLHRSLGASLSIRSLPAGQPDDGLLRLRLSVSSETPYLRSSYWDDPWVETLGHKEGEVDLTRLNGGAAVLANHNRWGASGNTPLSGIGVIERAWLENDRLNADIIISRREALADLRQDIADGLVKNVSIGYIINERTLTQAHGDGKPADYRVTSWTPHEVSLVDIPADASVGLGRTQANQQGDANSIQPSPQYRIIDLPSNTSPPPTAGDINQGVRQMPNTTPPAAAQTTAPAATITVDSTRAIEAERTRAIEIAAIGRQFAMENDASKAIASGQSLDAFRAHALNNLKDSGKIRAAESPEIGLSQKDQEQFSFLRALRAAEDPLAARSIAPFEFECSRAAQNKRSDDQNKGRESAITIPADMLNRALSAGVPSAGGNLVATDLLTSSFIDMLRNAMIVDKLGITYLKDLSGNVAIPSQTGGATAYWVPEDGNVTLSDVAFGQILLKPKTVGAAIPFSRQLTLQSSLDIESFVRNEIAKALGLKLQAALINGSGTGNEPTGLLNTSGVGAVIGGANGALINYDHLVDLETAIDTADADTGEMSYLTNGKVRGRLRKIAELGNTNGNAVWKSVSGQPGVGEVLGYGAYKTNAVPSSLTKGSANICSAVICGVFEHILMGMWGGLDLLLDPYTNSLSGGRRVIALQSVDIAVRYPQAFAVMRDALTS